MNVNFNKTLTAAFLPLIAVSSMLSAARGESRGADHCAPEPAATCYADDCQTCYCLGPENYGVNAAVCPHTCDGDWIFNIAGIAWTAHMDGMEYAVISKADSTNTLFDAKYIAPNDDWDFGFKIGAGYCSPCDGWDINVLWTWYQNRTSKRTEATANECETLIPLWANNSSSPEATEISSKWKLDLNLIDIEMGRQFWTSKYLSIRPFVGVRVSIIKQELDLEHKGETFAGVVDFVDLQNDFKGAGLRAGLDSTWNLGCGWAIYGNAAFDIVYGRFDFDHNEHTRASASPFAKTNILEAENHFCSSRFMADLGLGIQWGGMICDCKYYFQGQLGWEQHIFMDINQMWRVNRVGGDTTTGSSPSNVYQQRRGDLDTAGVTLAFKFGF